MFGQLIESVRAEVTEARTRHSRPRRKRNYDPDKGPEMQSGSRARERMTKSIGGAMGGGKLTSLGRGFSSKHGSRAEQLRKSVKDRKSKQSRREMNRELKKATRSRETPVIKKRTTSGEAQRMSGSPRTIGPDTFSDPAFGNKR